MRVSLTSTTGFLNWKTEDATDLDYTPLPLIRRNNNEESFQFTQEVRVASAPNASIRLSDAAVMKWQAGLFLFTQNYDQDAVNSFSPFVLSPFIPFPVAQTLAAGGAGRLRHRRLRAGHGDARESIRPDRRRARGQRAEGRGAEHVLHAAARPRRPTSTRTRASRTSRRSSRRRSGCSRRRPSTSRSRAATRRAGSTRCRRWAARRTARSTRGTSRAASRRAGPPGA